MPTTVDHTSSACIQCQVWELPAAMTMDKVALDKELTSDGAVHVAILPPDVVVPLVSLIYDATTG